MLTMKEIYLCDGRKFKTYHEVLVYCEQNNLRVTNTQTLRKNVYLILVHGVDYAKQMKSIL